MKYKIAAFFEGRNGFDELSRTIAWGGVIMIIVSMFIPVDWLSSVVCGISLCAFIYSYVRVFSKKLDRRQAENNRYLAWRNGLKRRWTERKTHRFYNCPKCRTTLRVPKGKGKISITCRCCGEKFIKKT